MPRDALRTCLVLGSAPCLWDDVERAQALHRFDAVIAAKQAGIYWPGELYSWVTLHPDWMPDYIAQREANGYPPAREIVAHKKRSIVEKEFHYRWPGAHDTAASGMSAAKYAVCDCGFIRVVLCGIPMEVGPRIDGEGKWNEGMVQKYRAAMVPVLDDVRKYVRSMSGWTREVLGEPTVEWLDEDCAVYPGGARPGEGKAVPAH